MNLAEASNAAKKMLGNQWVKWIHGGSAPANTATEKKMNVINSSINPKHCASCLNMNGCCFVKDKSPDNPLHEHCHCYYEDSGIPDVQVTSSMAKYTEYVFNVGNDEGKDALFEAWGYSIYDADYIKSEIERQALLAYQCGDYILGSRNEYGQRINTVIHLKRRDTGADVSFVSGWMSYPDGRLVLITPYGGKRK